MATYDLLDSLTLSSSASSVTFSSIDQSYRDLVLVCSVRSSNANSMIMLLRMNGDSGSNYKWVNMEGDGSNATSVTDFAGSGQQSIWLSANDQTANGSTPNTVIVQFMDFSATNKHKTILQRSNNAATSGGTYAGAGRWANTAAVTSITLLDFYGYSFISGSTFYLYGVAA